MRKLEYHELSATKEKPILEKKNILEIFGIGIYFERLTAEG
jgi:hypothetical protein